MDKQQTQAFIAKRVAQELTEGSIVNLGIGLPTLVSNFVPEDKNILIHAENGFLGLGPVPLEGQEDRDIVNAGGACVTILPGGVFFDSATSFGIIRGGHLDVTVLGALEVDEMGNIANYMIPGKMVPGMGGAMDLLSGAKCVIVAMEHTAKGNPKLVEKCSLPLTAVAAVDLITTEMGVIEVTPEGFVLTEYNPEYTLAQIQEATQAKLIISDDLKVMQVEE
ncbi:MAG: 3-oxoacid CoA-transferase subunit B [Clostridiales bacterium]|nr:3-oxoacid CoA-transferase subunit B [Clostridiales bacterium]